MITHQLRNGLDSFCLSTRNFSYLFHIDGKGVPVLDHYGECLAEGAIDSLCDDVCLDKEEIRDCGPAEFSFRNGNENASLILEKGDYCVFDFRYVGYRVSSPLPLEGLPSPRGGEELTLFLEDGAMGACLELHYVLYEEGVLGRYCRIRNRGEGGLSIKKAMSYQVCLESRGYVLESYFGNWAGEFQKEETEIKRMGYFFGSETGSSGDQSSPLFLLKEKGSASGEGRAYGFQLIYSGSHREEIQEDSYGRIRVMSGISPLGFSYDLLPGESFLTPMGLLAFSQEGVNGVSKAFSSFARERVLPSGHAKDLRPVLYNNWEGTYFDFNEEKLLRLARIAKKLGIELFVLDDGWFGKRNFDTSSLGDYNVYKKKLPHGLASLSKKIHKMGMLFGLWFEPEAISIDSDLYRAHPEYVLEDGLHKPSLGRHELLLDLTKKEVRDYIVENVSRTIEEADVDFIKWDYNRIITDLPHKNAYMHRYILGLYEILFALRERFPLLWMENCASGGGRNDLGMMSFFDTCWVSDNTDSYERSFMQANMAKGFPLSCMSCHVSAKTSHQMLRKTSFDTKFDIASFGVLGYELNLNELDPIDMEEIKAQIAYYKMVRPIVQQGEFAILEEKQDSFTLMAQKDGETLILKTNSVTNTHPNEEPLLIKGLDPNKLYSYAVKEEDISFLKFGSLINYVSPIRLKEEGKIVHFLSRRKSLKNELFTGTAYGATLMNQGVKLPPEWNSVGLDRNVRVMGDFGARLYFVKEIEKE